MNDVQTYWLEETGKQQVGLRRYTRHAGEWTCEAGWHQALSIAGHVDAVLDERGILQPVPPTPHDDPRWPTECWASSYCDYQFTDDDPWQDWQDRLYRRTDTGEEMTLRDAPPGACWNASWLPDNYRGPDGIALMVRCPDGHDWTVDGRASNCTRPEDDTHHCWVRHGDPRECHVTVDKNGDTCSAGAGSIATPKWHGFLRDGRLVA